MAGSAEPRRFLATGPCAAGRVVALSPEQSRHMVTVLRIGAGARVRVFTGEGREFEAEVETADPTGARVRILRPVVPRAGLAARVTLAFAPPPGQRADLIVEKATELGAAVLQPLLCERLQASRAEAACRRVERWQRKALDAARQSERLAVPEVRPPVPFERFVEGCGAALRLIGSPEAATGLWAVLNDVEEMPASVALVVGPAGGFTGRELELAGRAGFAPVSLGPHVLRVETAAVCMLAAAVLWLEGRAPREP